MICSRMVRVPRALQGVPSILAGVLTGRLGVAVASPGIGARQPPVPRRDNGRVTSAWSASAPCPVGQCCGNAGICGPCLVFVSSTEQPGDLGGLAGADAICQRLARAAGLPGRYRDWLSTGSASPGTRFTRATMPYTLPDGTVIAHHWSDLTGGSLRHSIDRTEAGEGINAGDTAWSNTLPNGAPAGSAPWAHCSNWAAAGAGEDGHVGIPFSTREDWSYTGSLMYCAAPQRLYCFQQL
jgi:hypothetical protein